MSGIVQSRVVSQHVEYSLFGSIEEFDQYSDMIEELANLTSSDIVTIAINCSGGSISVGMEVVRAIRTCKAPTHAVVHAPSYSMGSMIALACDEVHLEPNTFLMFHNYSSGSAGKGAELVEDVITMDRYANRLFSSLCIPFLTKKEIKAICSDKDLYIHDTDDDLIDRQVRHSNARFTYKLDRCATSAKLTKVKGK